MSGDPTPATCCDCGKPGDLRPYGPGGAPICFDCMKATPEREALAHAAFGAQMQAAAAISPIGAIMLTSEGPEPLFDEDLPPHAIDSIIP